MGKNVTFLSTEDKSKNKNQLKVPRELSRSPQKELKKRKGNKRPNKKIENENVDFSQSKDKEDDQLASSDKSSYWNKLDEKVADLISKDPERDCRKYNINKRANELFDALDTDKDGQVDEDEFVDGCLLDEVFVDLLENFNGENIWGAVGL